MAIQLGNITFNNVSTVGVGSDFANVIKSGRDADSINNLNTKAVSGAITTEKLAQSIGVLDAVSINWNDAIVSGQELNTTGEMLSILQTA